MNKINQRKMSVGIHLNLSAANKSDWESEGRKVQGSELRPPSGVSLAIWEGLSQCPSLWMGPPSHPGSSQGDFGGYTGAPVEWSEAICIDVCGILLSPGSTWPQLLLVVIPQTWGKPSYRQNQDQEESRTWRTAEEQRCCSPTSKLFY